tara:strand:+ start:388 stop:831 length:444 start_codon:yes stop_codon:yes gene_type:complete
METKKGHTGGYTGNYHRHTKVTAGNFDATRRDDEAHMQYLKEDVDYDNKHGHSDSSMTADEKHISKIAGDLKYDEKHHGPGKMLGDRNNNGVMEGWEKAISNKIKQNSGPAQKNIVPAGSDPDGEKDSVDIGKSRRPKAPRDYRSRK